MARPDDLLFIASRLVQLKRGKGDEKGKRGRSVPIALFPIIAIQMFFKH